ETRESHVSTLHYLLYTSSHSLSHYLSTTTTLGFPLYSTLLPIPSSMFRLPVTLSSAVEAPLASTTASVTSRLSASRREAKLISALSDSAVPLKSASALPVRLIVTFFAVSTPRARIGPFKSM